MKRLLLVGHRGGTHVGESLLRAAQQLDIQVEFADAAAAYAGPWWQRQLNWRLRGHRPVRLLQFSAAVEAQAIATGSRWLISTGAAPLTAETLSRLSQRGVSSLNFSTDDPFNPVHRASWFNRALREYSVVCTPRFSNIDDLRELGCRRVERLLFGYDPTYCAGAPVSAAVLEAARDQVLFVGGADADRRPYAEAVIRAGLRPALYGGYWDRWPLTAPFARGLTDPDTLRQLTAASAICVGLVRRANRDGHVMRSLEIGACGGCMLAEDTAEHRELFGAEDECVRYFRDPASLAAAALKLLPDAAARRRLAQALQHRILGGAHQYRDRLAQMLKLLGEVRS